jgi:hypothetical protein
MNRYDYEAMGEWFWESQLMYWEKKACPIASLSNTTAASRKNRGLRCYEPTDNRL